MNKPQIKDIIWHVLKTLLCALQFTVLYFLLRPEFVDIWRVFSGDSGLIDAVAHMIPPAIIAALFFIIWGYYDNIDDRSFNRVCAAAEDPKFLRDPAYLLGIAVTVAAVTPPLHSALVPLFRYLGLGSGAVALSLLSALLITVGGSLLRVSRLNTRWCIQSKMSRAKPPSVPWRIFYAITFFVALLLINKAIVIGVMIFTMILTGAFIPVLVIALLIFLWCFAILPLLNIPARRKFMLRLQELQKQGKVSVEIHGHPYLSLFFEFVPFGLTVTVTPHPDAKEQKETTYKATFANCKRRREIVILCEGNVYQFVYSLKFSHIDRFSRMGADNARVRTVSLPGMTRFTNHTFDFPEGEGERILLIDRSPTVLAVRNVTGSDLFELDNASQVFGYTVYVKNAFINLLTRM